MEKAFDHFLAGDDGLARLLARLPAYQPAATQEHSFAAAARAAQMHHAVRPDFEPPASLAADFRSLASRLEEESATQRKHILKRIEAGAHPDDILRNRMHPATTRWLRLQAAQLRRQRKLRFRRLRQAILDNFGWPELRLAGLAAVCGAAAAHWAMQNAPTPMELALLDAFRDEVRFSAAMNTEPPKPATPPRKQAKQKEAPAVAAATNAHEASDPEPDMSASEPEPRVATLSHAAPASPASTESLPPQSDSMPASVAPAAAARFPIEKSLALQAQPAPPPPPPVAAAPAAPAARPMVKSMALAERSTAALPETALAEAAAMTDGIEARLDDSADELAARLPLRPAGEVWLVRVPSPAPAGLETWLDALREKMPESGRPARFEIRSDLPPGSKLRILPPPLR